LIGVGGQSPTGAEADRQWRFLASAAFSGGFMRIISDGDVLSRLLVSLTRKHDSISFASAWASFGTKFIQTLCNNVNKIKRGVIGTHFYQTDPDVLDLFIDKKNLHFVLQPSGVFHPKVYFFFTMENWDLVIGSANMTHGAFGTNQELCLHISSHDIELNVAKELKKEAISIINEMWKTGAVMNSSEALIYRNMYNIQKHRADRLSCQYGSHKKSKSPIKSKIMSMTWQEFFYKVQNDKHHSVNGRCFILKNAREKFEEIPLSLMDHDWRKAIAGITTDDFLGHDWGWFGSMKGSIVLKSLIKNDYTHLSNALDIIPLNGAIIYNNYLAYIDEFKKAFPNGRDGIALASRLLALKRPDYFLCLNGKNRVALCDEFEIKRVSVKDYERYWAELIARIIDSVWWNSPEPASDPEKAVWKGRAAMLDAIFYNSDA
jgi:HKD family nuclease